MNLKYFREDICRCAAILMMPFGGGRVDVVRESFSVASVSSIINTCILFFYLGHTIYLTSGDIVTRSDDVGTITIAHDT